MSDSTQSRFGFVNFAETWNGRLAMLGVAGNMLAEGQTGMTFKEQLLALNFNPFA